MINPSSLIFVVSIGLMTGLRAQADVLLAPLFRDGAVLQRDRPLVVWGSASEGETVQVRFHGQSVDAVATSGGQWQATLSPEKASTEPAELVVIGKTTVGVHDILVGDVWLCSGQSNMEFTVAQAKDAAAEIASARFPLIRHFKVPHTVASSPKTECGGEWISCSPATAGEFTAIGYFFARELHERLRVPIGLVNSTWGGTQIESWMSEAALRRDPAAAAMFQRWQDVVAEYPAKLAAYQQAKASGKVTVRRQPAAPDGPGSHRQPAGIYNAMIAPLLPATLCGVLWYQGEANAVRANEYYPLFSGMIRQWRADFAQPRLPFYFVQLAYFAKPADTSQQQWAFLREAQTRALALPETGMAVAIDIGDAKRIHPKNKQEVGRRLALIARARQVYQSIEYSGPLFSSVRKEGSGLRVAFTHANGLRFTGKELKGFEIAGDDRVFVPANARIDHNDIVVAAEGVTAPAAVRYAWRNAPEATLINAEGLPASPFRSDTW